MVCHHNRYQWAGEMRPTPISVKISAGIDHGWQFTRTVCDRKRLVHPRQAHRRERFDLHFCELHVVEPDVWISRIRLSDWLHREARETDH